MGWLRGSGLPLGVGGSPGPGWCTTSPRRLTIPMLGCSWGWDWQVINSCLCCLSLSPAFCFLSFSFSCFFLPFLLPSLLPSFLRSFLPPFYSSPFDFVHSLCLFRCRSLFRSFFFSLSVIACLLSSALLLALPLFCPASVLAFFQLASYLSPQLCASATLADFRQHSSSLRYPPARPASTQTPSTSSKITLT